MRGAKRSAKNTAKNISLLVLCGLMGVLCAVNWLMGLNIAQMPADSALRRLHDRFVGGAVGYEIRSSGVSAADPAQMALTVDGKLYGVQYNLTDIDAGITATRSLWSQALTGEGLRPADESELCTVLRSGSCALLRYHGAIPMQSIAGWLGGSWKDNDRLQVETLVYAAGVQRLFVRMADRANLPPMVGDGNASSRLASTSLSQRGQVHAFGRQDRLTAASRERKPCAHHS